MKKRVLALLLSVLMTLSLLPVSAFAADLAGDGWEEIGTATSGEYTDTTAKSDTEYEYTVVGSDGSAQTVDVPAADDTGDSYKTDYGEVVPTTGTGETYYELVTNGAAGIEADKDQYLIVSANSGDAYALNKDGSAVAVNISDSKIAKEVSDAEFTLVSDGNGGYYLKDSGGTYLWLQYTAIYPAQTSAQNAFTIDGDSSVKFYYTYTNGRWNYNYYLHYSTNYYGQSGFSGNYGSGNSLYLFHKETEDAGEAFKVDWYDKAKALLDECNDLIKDNYTEASWTESNFEAARTAANEAYNHGSYATEADANAALDTMTALAEAKAKLVKGEVFYPEITWTRTLEPKYGTTYTQGTTGKLVRDLQYIQASDLQTISWVDTDVIKLDTDPSMKVWDYNTEQQYSNATKTSGISAATWQHWTNTQTDWKYASVRKFSGTFTWPEGYDLDDTITLISANDSNYTPIYEYIAANETYSARVGDRKIIAINDDMYVYVYVDGDKPTSLTNNSYLAFYTGSVGKGIWSDVSNANDDWGRTEPSSYNGTYATYAFHGVYPNLADDTSKTGVTAIADASYLNHTDGWYTFVDGSTISTVLKNHYANESLENRTVHIDIYCFDNSKNGGMDELKLMLKKAPAKTATVTVEYYLNSLNTANLLGTSTMTGVPIDTEITLDNGFDVNQLNFKKAEAIVKAGNKNVTDGVQQGTVPYVVVEGDNVIKVLYTTLDSKVIRVVADDGEFPYDGSEKTVPTYKVYMNGQELTRRNDGTYETTDGNFIQNVIETTGSGTNPGAYGNGIRYKSTITVKDAYGNNVSNSYTFYEEPGTIRITYTPADATYTYDFGISNQYDKVFDDVEQKAEITTTNTSVAIDKDANTITYTPKTVNTDEEVALTLTFAGGYSVTKNITFLPESNVMYEENMVTANDSVWRTAGTPDTKLVTDHDIPYGYTEAYAEDTGFSNDSALYATLTQGEFTDAATFSFTGTGFDLISECGTNTGILLVGVKDTNDNAVKAYMVDTYFCGDEEYVKGDGILDYQVPVVRNLELEYGSYTVTVTGYLNSASGAVVNSNGVATQSANNAVPSVDEIFRAAGMSEYLDAGVEVSFMDDNSVLNGGTGPEVTTPGFFSRVRSFFRGLVSTQAAPADNAICAYIDAFRVYKPLKADPEVYDETEQGTKYYSLYDFVKATVNDLDYRDKMAVYIEYDGETDTAAIADYKDQGPENEVYLTPGSAIAFALNGYQDGNTVQVSAKAVTAGANMGEIELSTTEMYYTVEIEDEDAIGPYVIIENIGKGVLSVSGLKVSKNISPVASAELGEKVTEKLNGSTEDNQFVPENLTVTAPSSAKVNRNFAIKIEASAKDVTRVEITVGDETSELTASNTKAVAQGKASNYKYSKLVKESTAGTYTYTVIAYDNAGNKSAPVTVTVTVK